MAMTEAALQPLAFGLLRHHLEMKASSQGQAGRPGLVAPRAGAGGVPQAKEFSKLLVHAVSLLEDFPIGESLSSF